ncbi:hypothetical protein D3C76_565260 [compost metagenome]
MVGAGSHPVDTWFSLAHQILPELVDLAFHPNRDGDQLIGYLGIQHGQAEKTGPDQRSNFSVYLLGLMVHLAHGGLYAFGAPTDSLRCPTLQIAQLFALQGVVLAELYLDLKFGEVNPVVQQLARTVESGNSARDTGPQYRLEPGTGGVERTEELGHPRLEVRLDIATGLFAGQGLGHCRI